MKRSILVLLAAFVGAGALFAMPAAASHAWGNYHWARTANPFTVKVINANTSDWVPYLDRAIADWNKSTVLDGVKEAGTAGRNCKAVAGKVKSCNAAYGQNGWLGLASISISGSHITQGTSKMNDTYFAMSQYNAPVKKQHVMCQEIGHNWGLGHQDESGADLNTCMDYANALDNPSPNQHDFDQLASIYAHLDSSSTIAAGMAGSETAVPVRSHRVDRISTSTITEEFADGTIRVTHVTWAIETRGRSHENRFDRGR